LKQTLPLLLKGLGLLLLSCLLMTCPLASSVWAEAYDADSESWSLINVNFVLPRKWRVSLEAQNRVANNLREQDRLLLRGAIGYQLHPKWSLWLGHAWTPSYQPRYNSEHRVFQQVIFQHRFKRLDVANRTRLEERFIAGMGETSYRFRTLFRGQYFLDARRKWSLVANDEIFFNLNNASRATSSGLDQNRTYVGVNHTFNPHVNLDVGYQMLILNRPAPQVNRLGHTLLVALNITLGKHVGKQPPQAPPQNIFVVRNTEDSPKPNAVKTTPLSNTSDPQGAATVAPSTEPTIPLAPAIDIPLSEGVFPAFHE
jgi:hypothetical protein